MISVFEHCRCVALIAISAFISIFPNQLQHVIEFLLCLFFIFIFYTLLSLSRNSGRLTWITARAALSSPAVIHRTLTWITGYVTCVRDHSYACVYTRGLGTPTTRQHNIFDSEKLQQLLLVVLTGFEPRVSASRFRCSSN